MLAKTFGKIFLTLSTLLLPLLTTAQSYTMTNSDTLYLDACDIMNGTLYDDGGVDGNYSNGFDGWVVITANPGASITLTGDYQFEGCCDYLNVWDGDPNQGTRLVNEVCGSGSINVTATSGRLSLWFRSDGSVTYSGFAFAIAITGMTNTCNGSATGVTASGIGTTTATLGWSGDAPSYNVYLNGFLSATTSATSLSLTGLNPNTVHHVMVAPADTLASHCCATSTSFTTACATMRLPVVENFNNATIGYMPDCWTRSVNFDDVESMPQTVLSGNNDNALMLSCGSNATSGHFGMVVGPKVGSGETWWRVSCRMRPSHWNTVVMVGVCDSTSPEYSNYGFTPIETVHLYDNWTWNDYTFSFTLPQGACKIAFRMVRSDQDGDMRMVYLDDLKIESCGVYDCYNYHTDTSETTIAWSTFGNPTVNVGIRPAGYANNTLYFPAATSPLHITGLDPGTRYTVSLYPVCNGVNGIMRDMTMQTLAPSEPVTHYCIDNSNIGELTFINAYNIYATDVSGIHANHQQGNKAYIVSPQFAGLAGKEITVRVIGYYSEVTLGTMDYVDDTSTFTPLAYCNTDYYGTRYLKATVPTSSTARFVVLRFNSEIDFHNLEVGACLLDSVHITHQRGTSVTFAWEHLAPTDTVLVEYGQPGFEPDSGTVRTFVGVNRAKIDSLSYGTDYEFIVRRSCQTTSCGTSRYRGSTGYNDHVVPFCTNFNYVEWNDREWSGVDGVLNYPTTGDEYVEHHYRQVMQFMSYGFDWGYYSTVRLPDVELDTGAVLSFYATNTAPQGVMMVGMRIYDQNYWFDTIALSSDGARHQYSVALPANDSLFDNRLVLHYRHNTEYTGYVCYVDELRLWHGGYNNFSVVHVGYDTAAFSFTLYGEVDSARAFLVSLGGDTIACNGLSRNGSVWTATFGGLDSGAAYECFIEPLPEGCASLAGSLITHHNWTGGGYPSCETFDNLLSYELPAGWQFGGAASIVSYGDDDGVLLIGSSSATAPAVQSAAVLPIVGANLVVEAAGDTLLVGYITDDSLRATTAITVTDTLKLSATPTTLQLPLTTPPGARICLVARGTCYLLRVGVNNCPVVNFETEGGTLICRVDGNVGVDYILTVNSGNWSRNYRITTSPYRLEGLRPGNYELEYHCTYNDDGCMPKALVTLSDSIASPYCETFEIGDGSTGVPQNWTFIYSHADEEPRIDAGWWETPLAMGSDSHWDRCQYAVLPPTIEKGFITVKVNAYIWCNRWLEIGTMATATDTASFVPLARSEWCDNWGNVSASIDSIGDRRIAIRTYGGIAYLNRVTVSDMPDVKVSLVNSRTLVLTANNDRSYFMRYEDYWGHDTIMLIDTTVYVMELAEEVNNVRLTPVMDSTGYTCTNEYLDLELSELATLPYCINEYWWDWPLKRHCGVHCPGEIYIDGTYSAVFNSCNHVGGGEYKLLHDLDIDSVKRLTMSFTMKSDHYSDMIEVGVMSDAYDTASFVVVDSIEYDDAELMWHTYNVSFEDYSGTGRWIAFRHRSGACASCEDGTYLYLDDVCVSACDASAATVTLNHYNEVSIAVANGASTTDFYAEYGPTGFAQGTGTTVHIVNNPTVLTLAQMSSYDFYLRCSSTGQTCMKPQQVTTMANPLIPPVCINFDNTASGTLPQGWSSTGSTASTVESSQSHSGSNSLTVVERVISPDIAVDSLQEVKMGLWVMAEDAGDRLEVGAMTDPANPITFTRMTTIAPQQTGVWEYHQVSFKSAPNNAHFIALRHRNSTSSTLTGTLHVDDVSLSTCGAFGLRITTVESESTTLTWEQVGEPGITVTVIENGTTTTGSYNPVRPPLTINNLTPHNSYTFVMHAGCTMGTTPCDTPYDDTLNILTPKPGVGCVNPTDMGSPYSTFFSGTFKNPYAHDGAIDFGSTSTDSRHTVCYDTNERDPRTGGLLRTVPEGSVASVRLGNWNTDALRPQAEGITYSLFVDTLSFDLLIMRYAAVLQDPMHAAADQPRFRLELLDSNFVPINPECTSADFIADRSLGWNEAADNVLWKDWTTYGVDLTAYADQQVYVRLTTYDCNEGSHYGYAYFTLECMRRNIVTDNCGNIDSNTFTAPAGFNYRWYTATAPAVTLSNEQTFAAAAVETTYYCDVSSTENASCMFTISAFAGARFPLAIIDTVVSISNCSFTVRFDNMSTISNDGVTPLGTGEPCETAYWDFGNGETSTNYHGRSHYDSAGTYTVTLVSGIAGNSCTDTMVMTLTLAFPPHTPRIEGPTSLCNGGIDTLFMYDTHPQDSTLWTEKRDAWIMPLSPNNYTLGTNNYATPTVDQYGCGQTFTNIVTVNPIFHQVDTVHICTPLLPYSYPDTTFLEGTTSAEYHNNLLSAAGCDSSYHLWLTVSDAMASTVRDTANVSICDNETYLFFGNSYNTTGEHTNVHVDQTGMCDSIHTLMLEVRLTSSADTFAVECDQFSWYGTLFNADTNTTRTDANTVLCDSTTTLHLTVHYSSDTTVNHTVIENNLPYLWNGISFGSDTAGYIYHTTNRYGCDSTIDFNLTVYRNQFTTVGNTICDGMLPIVWNGISFGIDEIDSTTNTITHQATLNTSHGADSTVTMVLTIRFDSEAYLSDTIVQNNIATFTPALPVPLAYTQNEADPPLVGIIDTTMVLLNAVNCDSTVHYTLFVWRNYHTYDSAECCDNQLPYSYLDTAVTTTDPVATYDFLLSTVNGADSLVSLTLSVHPTFEVGDTFVICPHKPYLYEGVDYGGPIDFDSPHTSVLGCDSLVHVSLQPRDTLFRLAPAMSLDSSEWFNYDSTLLGCAPQHLWLNDTSSSISREWTFWPAETPDSAVSDTLNLFDTILPIGIYSFRLIAVGEEGCYDTIQRDSAIYIFPRPVSEFRSEPFNIPNHDPQVELFTLATPADSLTYRWLLATTADGEPTDSLTESLGGRWTYRWETNIEEGEYEVALVAYWLHTVDSHSVTCTDTARHTIMIVNTYLQFPNLVSPNGDGENDIWGIVNLLEYREYPNNELWIYDRSGTLIYHVRDIRSAEQFWDPNATNSPDGTYYYRFGAQNIYGAIKHNGIIEVLR
ncbi:MAG: gliding motility-associated C-terminal domain-containing protein [Bacteroidales bacterium]|nr:gliding motility-associated C-terminal domain-containing protein [Bacteroidales bacterium]